MTWIEALAGEAESSWSWPARPDYEHAALLFARYSLTRPSHVRREAGDGIERSGLAGLSRLTTTGIATDAAFPVREPPRRLHRSSRRISFGARIVRAAESGRWSPPLRRRPPGRSSRRPRMPGRDDARLQTRERPTARAIEEEQLDVLDGLDQREKQVPFRSFTLTAPYVDRASRIRARGSRTRRARVEASSGRSARTGEAP